MYNIPPAGYVRKSDNPCFGCIPPDRHPGCHGNCPKRVEYLRKIADIKARREAYIKNTYVLKKWKKTY